MKKNTSNVDASQQKNIQVLTNTDYEETMNRINWENMQPKPKAPPR